MREVLDSMEVFLLMDTYEKVLVSIDTYEKVLDSMDTYELSISLDGHLREKYLSWWTLMRKY